MSKELVGQVVDIHQEMGYQTLTIETPRGDTVFIRYEGDVAGVTPYVGGVYQITYSVDSGILRATFVKKPEPGRYRAEFERVDDYQEAPQPAPSRYDAYGDYAPSRTSTYAPTRSVSKGVRPDGLSLIAVLMLIVGMSGLSFGFIIMAIPFIALIGMLIAVFAGCALLLAYGLWTYHEWARIGMIIVGALFCLTIAGIVVGVPIIWYLEQRRIKTMFF
ncbi:MAG: hypothetical protein ACFFEF_08265 [Candidatus Thorarchaeota archaeon]